MADPPPKNIFEAACADEPTYKSPPIKAPPLTFNLYVPVSVVPIATLPLFAILIFSSLIEALPPSYEALHKNTIEPISYCPVLQCPIAHLLHPLLSVDNPIKVAVPFPLFA